MTDIANKVQQISSRQTLFLGLRSADVIWHLSAVIARGVDKLEDVLNQQVPEVARMAELKALLR